MLSSVLSGPDLPALPDGWLLSRLEELAEINPESLSITTPSNYLFRYIDLSAVEKGAIDWSLVQETNFRDAPSRARRLVRPDDVLFGTVRPSLQSHGAIPSSKTNPLVASTGFAIIRARSGEAIGRFLFHTVMADLFGMQARRTEVGSNYPAVNESDVRLFLVAHPSLSEQRRIAEILDTIDEAVRRTEQVIEKLQQLKQGLLHDLLTRGIDDNGELRPPPEQAPHLYKNSPLGLIPKEWKILRVQDVSTRITDGDHQTPVRAAQGVFLLSARNVLDGQLDLSDVDFIPRFEYERMIRRCFPEAGDLLVSCSGTIGRVCEVPEGFDCALVRSAALVKLNRQLANARYMEWVLLSEITKQQIRARQKQGAQPNLFQGEIAELLIALPPMTEQSDISRLLDGAMLRLRREEGLTTKLRTLKKGLMDDLLTGRVRVTVPEGEC